jgi:signal transduction histidine kinase
VGDPHGGGGTYGGRMERVRVRTWVGRLTVADRVAVGLGLLVIPLFALSNEPNGLADRSVDAVAILILGLAGILLLFRRRYPATVVLAATGLGCLWYLRGYTNGVINVAMLVAFYNLGTTGDRRKQIGVGVMALTVPLVSIVAFADVPVTEAVDAVGYPLAAILFGEIVRGRRLLLAEYADKAAAAEAQTERRVAEERLRIAQDVHDVLAHAVAVMTVQAGVGADALDRDPDAVRDALATIRSAGKDAMAELRATVVGLRGSEPADIAPAPQLDRLAELVDGARAQGLDVDLVAELGPAGPSVEGLVQLTAYRVVQESLTNVIRHAHASQATVRLERQRSQLVVAVSDDGNRPRVPLPMYLPRAPVGFGLRGMRERVESLGGALRFGPKPNGGGWEVVATLPVRTGP